MAALEARRVALRAILACGLALAAAAPLACGSGGSRDVPLTVGVVPIADVAPLYLGREEGFFAAEGLDVQPEVAPGGAAITPAVLDGDLQFGFSNTVSLLIAASSGRPVRIVSQGVLGGSSERTAWADLLVRRDRGIRSAKDL